MIMLANFSSNRAPGYEREREEGGWVADPDVVTDGKPQRPRTYTLYSVAKQNVEFVHGSF